MKIRSLLFISLFFLCSLHGQPWLENLPTNKANHELTLFDYKQAFYSYWEPFNVQRGHYKLNGKDVKAAGWKQFKRWEYQMLSVVDKQTGTFPKQTAQEICDRFVRRSHPAANWSPMGPVTSNGGYAGIGRINCVAFHPTDNTTYWVGAAAGGLWVTTDNGGTWTCMTDQNGVLAVSDIIIQQDYDTSKTIYIATGDRDGWDNRSIGVLKSTNGGITWNPTGLTYNISEGQMVNRLLVDPVNPDILIAATTQGVFRTTNGGDKWDEELTGTEFIDMEYQPGNFSILYGSTKGGDIFLSANDGNSWTQAFHDDEANRVELAVSPNQPGWVYAVASSGDSGLRGIWKSINGGSSYEQVFDRSTANLLTWASDGDDGGGQGWYDLSLAASPVNADVLLVGGVNTWRSVDGGNNWSIVSHWSGHTVQEVHADKHMLKFRSNGDLFECNDGGIYFSPNNGSQWFDKTNGIMISQMYKLGVSQTEYGDVMTGLQDNGSKLLSGGQWSDVRGGDGMECLIDYSDVDIQYSTLYYGRIDRTMNHWDNARDISPSEAGDGGWITPYIIDPSDPATLYAGYQEVWKTADRGDSWEPISTFNEGTLQHLAIAPTDNQIICAAHYNHLWRTTNGGGNWQEITYDLPTGEGSVQSIAFDVSDPAIVRVAFSGYSTPGVYELGAGETSWTNISQGLPPIPCVSLVQNAQSPTEAQLYVGTELGVYFKKGTDDWVAYNTALPNVKMGEIEIYYDDNPEQSMLRAASYGRGLWESPVVYEPKPMTYASSLARHPDISPVFPDHKDQVILKAEVVMDGNLSPLEVQSLKFSTAGTSVASDISAAKLFATGAGSSFSTLYPFGDTIMAPDGVMTFSDTRVLNPGINNFWLVYDVSNFATPGNILDAQFLSVTLDEESTPAVSDPTGNRMVQTEYCTAGTVDKYEHITNVTMGGVNQTSGWEDSGYSDFTSRVIEIETGIPEEVTVTTGDVYQADELLIWVDWNIDGDFEDDDERVFASGPGGQQLYSLTIAVPTTASLGMTRIRFRLHDTDNGPNDEPCGISDWGDVEDYSLRVIGSDPCSYLNYVASNAQNVAGDYIGLVDEGIIIETDDTDDANSEPQEIGFTFRYHCQEFTQFILNTNGFIKLGNTPTSKDNLFFNGAQSLDNGIFDSEDPADTDLIIPFNHDLDQGPNGLEFRLHTTGVAPQRVCIIQYKGIREWTTSTPYQYESMEFQVRLYESSNMIEFVYGDWTPTSNFSDFKTAAVGLKGGGNKNHQLVTVQKGSAQSWDGATFSDTNYPVTDAFGFGNPPDRPKPDAGRTYRFNSAPSPAPGNIGNHPFICVGHTTTLTLDNAEGRIQWQQSPDGVNAWTNVPGNGNGDTYETPPLTSTTYYRSEVSELGFVPVYSNTSQVTVTPPLQAPDQINGNNVVCNRETGVLYYIDQVPGATSYEWILSNGLTGASTTDSIYVDYGFPAEENEVSVRAMLHDCAGDLTTRKIFLYPEPDAPTIVEVIHPNCIIGTGSVHFSNMPDGMWVLIDIIGLTFVLDGGSEDYILDELEPGEYEYRVSNQFGCPSLPSEHITILPVSDPPKPVITESNNILHSDAAAGNQWYNQNGVIDGATSQDYLATEAGEYFVVVTLGGCISERSNTIEIFPTATEQVSPFAIIKVFPNPVGDELIIEYPGNTKGIELEIIDPVGHVIFSLEMFDKVSIPFKDKVPGMYMLTFISGQTTETRKIMKL